MTRMPSYRSLAQAWFEVYGGRWNNLSTRRQEERIQDLRRAVAQATALDAEVALVAEEDPPALIVQHVPPAV